MKNEDNRPPQAESSVISAQTLRQRAEEIAQDKEDRSSGDMVPHEEARQKLHELLVHQIELEMQNEELRRVQAELEDARAQYVDLYDFAPVGYCTISRKGLIVEANLTAAKLLGVPRGELINKPISRFILKEDQDVYYLHKLKLFETGEPLECELRLTKSNGTAFWAHLASVTLQDADDEPICHTILSDITKRKVMEEKLRWSAEELAHKNKLMTEFFTNISHEFKTPLSVILIQLELMKMYMDDEKKMNEYIAAATQNSYRLTRLVGNLLDITKLDAGYLKANFANADIVSLLRDICESVDLYAKARSIQLSNEIQMLNKVMPIDTEKIERIMLNLLSNAIKHTGKDGKITVSMKDRKDGGVTISVEDTGEGIPHDKQIIIFDRFAQVNTSMTRNTEGCGIGLALVKSLLDMLGGSIKVKSEVGYGSKFIINLPLLDIETQTTLPLVEGYDLSKKTAMELSDLYLEPIKG